MKHQFIPYLCSAFLSLGLVSCNLDFTPENAITYSNAFSSESELNTTTSTIHFYLNNAMDAVRPITRIGLLADESQFDQQLLSQTFCSKTSVPPKDSPKTATTITRVRHTSPSALVTSNSHAPTVKPLCPPMPKKFVSTTFPLNKKCSKQASLTLSKPTICFPTSLNSAM